MFKRAASTSNRHESDVAILCPVTGLTNQQKAVLKRSWWKMGGRNPDELRDFGVKFMLWMCEHVPQSVKRFSEAQDVEITYLPINPLFLAHAQLVLATIDKIIHCLRQPECLNMKIHDVVVAHIKLVPPVSVTFFQQMRDNICLLVTEALKVADDSEEVEAWSKLFDTFTRLFLEEHQIRDSTLLATKKRQCCQLQ